MSTSISQRLEEVRAALPDDVTLIAVSKFHPADAVRAAYEAGQRHFGESRANELKEKAQALPADIVWHFIGHLQTNKVKPVVAAASVIQSIDSERLLRAVDAEAKRQGKRITVLLQVHVAAEETKFGFTPEELTAFATPELVDSLAATDIVGVMGMASNTTDAERISADFAAISKVFDTLRSTTFKGNPDFATLSMGMSHDYPLALPHGATMVRVGTAIFGERQY